MTENIGNVLRDRWLTRFGLIMAMSGNAVGLGNFIRFPGQAAEHGGGAFMVPYFIALVLMGVPLMWIEWTIGRYGGAWGHGSTPGMFHRLWRNPISKYIGVFGVMLPAVIGLYYIYIESWSLGYAWQSITGAYWGSETQAAMGEVFGNYLGHGEGPFAFGRQAYLFFVITIVVNFFVFYRGISRGIELLAKYGMPLLLIMGLLLAARVLTLPMVDGRGVSEGLAQIWVVDWDALGAPAIWIAASGQVFFTLSLGFGMIHAYASYLTKDDDITLNGLATVGTNSFVEVILGSTVVVPAALIYFGMAGIEVITDEGTFAISFQTLPVIFQQLPFGQFFATVWFLLLFLAGLMSSVAMFVPLLSFLQDELDMDRNKALAGIFVAVFLLMQPIILYSHRGIMDELDFWVATFLIVVFACAEVVIFSWIFGIDKGWEAMHRGADLRVPRIFYYIMKYVTPVYAVGLLLWYMMDDEEGLVPVLMMDGVAEANRPILWLARLIILLFIAFLVWGVWHAWRTHPKFFDDRDETEEGTKEADVQ
ncbi:MAG: sodium-dependent transporter [Candidatus Hydrogenedentota bacterium]